MQLITECALSSYKAMSCAVLQSILPVAVRKNVRLLQKDGAVPAVSWKKNMAACSVCIQLYLPLHVLAEKTSNTLSVQNEIRSVHRVKHLRQVYVTAPIGEIGRPMLYMWLHYRICAHSQRPQADAH